ncbi:MAG TPA: AlkA N-terminal domain-containing protein [Gemmatimonadales bacterium]|nr:AlkA N-terminal domain-containing protein [Gemmatimonadales bacterium]
MFATPLPPTLPSPDVCERALNARDARFDGLFYVGITTTRIYCRPVCPARVSYHDRRRFFDTAASAERAGYRPCLRCRPELAPGRALIDAVPNLARVAAHRIAAGALNDRSVAALARELGVSDRHLRRVLERELGVSPVELAQTHRLLLAKRLLADTTLPVTRIAFASGFQSLRRFNAVFRERYRLSPSALRRGQRGAGGGGMAPAADGELVRLTLAYRPPLAWDALLSLISRDAIAGVELVADGRYARTVEVDGRAGVVLASDAAPSGRHYLEVQISPGLLPSLMPLLARLRHLFDLDAEPTVVDAHLDRAGLGRLVRRRPGLRIPGALGGFDAVLRAVLGPGDGATVAAALGAPLDTGIVGLDRLMPGAARIARAGPEALTGLGIARRRAEVLAAIAGEVAEGRLRLEPGSEVAQAHRALREIRGVDERLATTILMHALGWPDAFTAADQALQRAARAGGAVELRTRAESWRPWRAYAAAHLTLERPAQRAS